MAHLGFLLIAFLLPLSKIGHCLDLVEDVTINDIYYGNANVSSLLRSQGLESRAPFDTINVNKPTERQTVEAAIEEMIEIVEFVWDIGTTPTSEVFNIFQYYFPGGDWMEVRKVFRVIGDLYQSDKGPGQPLYDFSVDVERYRPTNLDQIQIDRDDSCCDRWSLAESENVEVDMDS